MKYSIFKNPFVIISLLVIIVATINFYFLRGGQVVATINGEPIHRKEFEKQLAWAGSDFMEEDILYYMIRNKLILQDAEREGVIVKEQEVENQYNQIIQQFSSEEELEKALKDSDMTREQLREDIKEEIIFEKYFEKIKEDREITVNSEEMEEYYKENEEIFKDSSFEEAQSQIKEVIVEQKTEILIEEIVEGLFQNSQIKTFL